MGADRFVDKVEFTDIAGKATESWTKDDKFEIKLENVTASSNQVANTYKPEFILDGKKETIVHTKSGADQWVKAEFNAGPYEVSSVKIQNSIANGYRIGKSAAKIEIDGKLCGSVPAVTKNGEWMEIKCAKVIRG